MKKGDIIPVKLTRFSKLNNVEGEILLDEKTPCENIVPNQPKIKIKNVIPGQEALVRITKKRRNKIEGQFIEYLNKEGLNYNFCEYADRCGGCTFHIITPEEELVLKDNYLRDLLKNYPYEGLIDVNKNRNYRNKMEYSFGNLEKDGELTLGMHEKNRYYNILNTNGCQLVSDDFEVLRKAILEFAKKKDYNFFHKRSHEGFLRFLVLRKGEKTGDLFVNLVTTSQDLLDEKEFTDMLLDLNLEGQIKGILWTKSDTHADAVIPEETKLLYGEYEIEDEILGKKFKISPYSFFQVNTYGADQLFEIVREFAEEALKDREDSVIYDLYSGTGTIGLLLADKAQRIYSIEIVEEAVERAIENAKLNSVDNISFIAGDVLNEAEKLGKHPDLIVLDPPRSGIHPKSIKKILDLSPDYYIYVSCNPVTLESDLNDFTEAGYKVERLKSVNLFPMTTNVETVALLKKENI